MYKHKYMYMHMYLYMYVTYMYIYMYIDIITYTHFLIDIFYSFFSDTLHLSIWQCKFPSVKVVDDS